MLEVDSDAADDDQHQLNVCPADDDDDDEPEVTSSNKKTWLSPSATLSDLRLRKLTLRVKCRQRSADDRRLFIALGVHAPLRAHQTPEEPEVTSSTRLIADVDRRPALSALRRRRLVVGRSSSSAVTRDRSSTSPGGDETHEDAEDGWSCCCCCCSPDDKSQLTQTDPRDAALHHAHRVAPVCHCRCPAATSRHFYFRCCTSFAVTERPTNPSSPLGAFLLGFRLIRLRPR